MKHLILLLALALPAAAQTLTNTNLDGVTNATINGVLDDDAAATRTALGLSTAATAANGTFTSQPMAWNGSAWSATTNVGANTFTAFDGVGETIEVNKTSIRHLDGSSFEHTSLVFAPITQQKIITFPNRTGTVSMTNDNNVFLAQDYGVTADGTTNDTVALQACIDAAAAAATPSARKTVVLPSGLIRLSRSPLWTSGETNKAAIYLKSNVNLRGQGIGSTTIKLLDSVVADCPTLLAYGATKTGSTTTSGSPTVTVSNTTQLLIGMSCVGTGIPADTVISAIPSGTTVTLSKNATANGAANVSLAFDHANIEICDLSIDGNAIVRGVDGGSEDEGINFKQGLNCMIRNVAIRNCGQDGIDLDAGKDIVILNCTFEDNFGNGIHAVGGGPTRVKVIGCDFKRNGFQRRSLGSLGLAGSGSAIDSLAVDLIIEGCTFRDNAVEFQSLAGHATITNCQIYHGGNGGPTLNLTTTLSAIVAGTTEGAASTDSSLTIMGCRLYTSVGSVVEAVNTFPLVQIVGNRILGSTTITSAARVIYNGNHQTGQYGIHLVATSKPAQICNNYFDVGYTNGLRIEASTGGLASGNHFVGTDGGALDIAFRAGSTGWKIVGNNFSSATTGVVSVSGGGGTAKIFGNTGGFDLSLGAASSIIKNNELDAVALQSGGSTSNVFEGNTISGTITHTTATFASNTWRRNTGAGCAGVFYGTATLASGTSGAITTAAANSARKWSLSRQAPNASTAIGNLALGTITANTSFVINALDASAATATGDLSTVYWEILE